jgi:hypothetical protein
LNIIVTGNVLAGDIIKINPDPITRFQHLGVKEGGVTY